MEFALVALVGALVVAVGALVAVVGVRLGMLVGPRIGRWADPDDEERRDHGPG